MDVQDAVYDSQRKKFYSVCGPPGCGKTTWVARQAKRAAEKYGADRVYILSLTRAAAAAVGGRDTGVPDTNVGTLHSLCFRILGTPKLVSSAQVHDWNNAHPHWSISPAIMGTSHEWLSPEEDAFSNVYQSIDRKRHKLDEPLTSFEFEFMRAWTDWKLQNEVVDFTQMIEDVIRFRRVPEPTPAVIFGDEAQDYSNLELSVLHQWADSAEKLILVGDMAQSIYDFHGASREGMERKATIVLEQSYRVPRAVWSRAEALLGRMSEVPSSHLKPRDEEGTVDHGPSIKFPEYYVSLEIERNPEETFMFIASCGYMLNPLVQVLRKKGIPYWNPYAPAEGRWNPLKLAIDGKVTTPQRLLAFMNGRDGWTGEQFKLWAPLFAGIYKRGALPLIESLRDEETPEVVELTFPEVFKVGKRPQLDPDWILENAHSKCAKPLEFLVPLMKRGGLEAVAREPKVIIGTIHSVKGGEADNVIVVPDLSPKWWELMQSDGWEGRDSVLRLFYVALTRPRKRLIIADPSTRYYLEGL